MAKRKRRPPMPDIQGWDDQTLCPCGSDSAYHACCARLHRGTRQAVTAVDVMRARYSAHVVGDHAYLLSSWHPDTRPPDVAGGDESWLGLEVGAVERGGALDATGTVAFAAHFRQGDRVRVLREISSFVRVQGRWVYFDGTFDF